MDRHGGGSARVHGEYKVPGGKLVVVDLALEGGHIAQVQVSGDFFLEPDTALEAINAAVRGLPADADVARIGAAVVAGLPGEAMLCGISAEGVAVAVRRAIDGAGA